MKKRNKLQSILRRMKPALIAVLLCWGAVTSVNAQVTITNPYPAGAQSLTRGLDTSLLTVEVNFLGACTGNAATITLAPGVTYIPGSVVKTAGNAGITIADLGGTANAPTFTIGGVTAAGSITFTIKRTAGCGTAASGKDIISVTGSCGTVTENDLNVNSYNLLSPSLSLTAPAAITGAFVGNTASRSITITNGGNGCLDTLRYYVVYPDGGIANTVAGNAITANGVNVVPSSTNGDTLFYKIAGAALSGGDNLLCNGETVTIVENIKVVKCNATTVYRAGWGDGATACQTAIGSGTLTMAAGVPNLSLAVSDSIVLKTCTPGISRYVITNNGAGSNAGALYNVIANMGFSDYGNALFKNSAGEFLSNFTYGAAPGVGIPLTTTISAGDTYFLADMSQFGSDPDAAGTGLDDLDGDGQFDDLAPGKKITIYFNRNFKNDTVSCPIPVFSHFVGATVTYNNMCGTSFTSLTGTTGAYGGVRTLYAIPNRTALAPPQVFNGEPFTVNITHAAAWYTAVGQTVDSFELKITLPPGVTYVPGTAKFQNMSLPASGVVVNGNTLTLYRKSGNGNNLWYVQDFAFDLIYDCSGGSSVSIPFEMIYVNDRSCPTGAVIQRMYCGTVSTQAVCPNPCPAGIANTKVSVARTTLGWTDQTMTTRVTAASLSKEVLATVAPLDTVVVTSSGQQATLAFSNAHYNFQISKASGAAVLQYVSGTYHYKPVGGGPVLTGTMPAPADLSDATITKWDWNLTGVAGAPAMLTTNDSIWVDITYVVTRANNSTLYGNIAQFAPDASAYFYSLDGTNTPQYCLPLIPPIRFIGYNQQTGTQFLISSNEGTLAGCNNVLIPVSYSSGHGNSTQPFAGEYRPKSYMDSIVITLPTGVSYDNTTTPTFAYSKYTSIYNYLPTISNIPHPVINGQDLIFVNNGNFIPSDFIPAFSQRDQRILFSVKSDCNAGNTTSLLPLYVRYYGKDFQWVPPTPVIPVVTTNTPAISAVVLKLDGTQRPALSVQNNTGTVQGILPQHYWDVQVNSTGTTTAPYMWMALEKGAASGIVVDSVVLKPSNVVMNPMSYGTGNKWYQVNAAGLTSGAIQQARIYFKYTNCTTDSILMRSGWSCTGYPSPDPASGYACTSADQYLKIIPQSSQAQIAMAYQPAGNINLCSQDSVTVIVNSAQAANLVNPYIVIYPPAGITFTTPFPVEYPLGSGTWQNVTPVSIAGGGYQVNLGSHTGIGVNGLPGTALNPGAAGRQAKIKLPFSASCDFASGSQLDFFVHGAKPCGDAADGDGLDVKSNPVKISGANATGNAAVSMSLGGSTTMTCGDTRTLSFSVTEVGTTSQAGDSAVYTIPAGLTYAGNFSGCAGCSLTTTTGSGGTLVKVALPIGLASGTTTSFSFDIAAANGGGCGGLPVNGQVERSIGGLFCGITPCTTSKVVIGTGTPVSITVNKPTLTITAVTRTTAGLLMPGSTHTLSVSVSNSSTIAVPASAYTVEFFCGSSTIPFASGSFPAAVAAGSSATANMTISIAAAPACNTGDAITAKISPVTTANAVQCMCNETAFTMSEVLPLHLVAFKADMQACKATLTWETVEEHSFSHFEVEYSANAQRFEKAGTVAGKNSASGGSYTFDYVQPTGKGYYRLRMVDLDGAAQLSNTIVTEADCRDQGRITLYPNPTQGLVEVGNVATGSIIKVYDHTGRLLLSKVAQHAKESINLSGFAAGSYAIVVINGTEQVFRTKVIRQ